MKKIENINLENTHKYVVDYLARLAYEVQANKDIIAELIERNKDNVTFLNSPIFKEYHKRFEDALASYKIGQDEFANIVLSLLLNSGLSCLDSSGYNFAIIS